MSIRGHRNLTEEQLALVDQAFRDGVPASEMARKLGRHPNRIRARYRALRGEGDMVRYYQRPKVVEKKHKPPNRASRFYHSDFEPS